MYMFCERNILSAEYMAEYTATLVVRNLSELEFYKKRLKYITPFSLKK